MFPFRLRLRAHCFYLYSIRYHDESETSSKYLHTFNMFWSVTTQNMRLSSLGWKSPKGSFVEEGKGEAFYGVICSNENDTRIEITSRSHLGWEKDPKRETCNLIIEFPDKRWLFVLIMIKEWKSLPLRCVIGTHDIYWLGWIQTELSVVRQKVTFLKKLETYWKSNN